MDNNSTIILQEIRELRKNVEELAADSKQRITSLEVLARPLFDNGQPGLLTKIQNRLTALERWQIKVMAICTAISTAIPFVIKFIFS